MKRGLEGQENAAAKEYGLQPGNFLTKLAQSKEVQVDAGGGAALLWEPEGWLAPLITQNTQIQFLD